MTTSSPNPKFVSSFSKFKLWLYSRVAIHWLRSSGIQGKEELVITKNFILKAERKLVRDGTNTSVLQSTFSLHKLEPPNTLGPREMWWYEKYELLPNSKEYVFMRSGKYPASWE